MSAALGVAAIRSTAERTLPRRRFTSFALLGLCALALGVALIPLVSILGYVVMRGATALSAEFVLNLPTPAGISGGGIANAIVGSLIIDGLAATLALPTGIFIALSLVERPGRLSDTARFTADVLAGIPSIAIGLLAYELVVVPSGHFSALAASVALAILMLPVTVRGAEAALAAVPRDLWEAGVALGLRRPRIARRVLLPAALPGLLTAGLLAVARAAGETAPLLFTAIGSDLFEVSPLRPMGAMPMTVFLDGTQAYADLQRTAWGAALLLVLLVLALNLSSRLIARRHRGSDR